MLGTVKAGHKLPALLTLTSFALLLTSCTEPKKTTGIGAAAGGALGAGLGAIIGNQTGNAGSGLAIGALAGTATGSLIGNALQAQQESIRSQDEAIERQERMIQAQKNEIAELRSLNSDVVDQKRSFLQKRGPNPTDRSKPTYSSLTPAVEKPSWNTSEARGRLSTETTGIRETTLPAKTVEPSRGGVDSVRERVAPPPVAQPPSNAKLSTSQSTQSKACEEASAESDRASAASEESDKLFHLRRALRLCPNNASLHHELGALYASMKRTADAEHEFKKALSLDPANDSARESLANLARGNEGY